MQERPLLDTRELDWGNPSVPSQRKSGATIGLLPLQVNCFVPQFQAVFSALTWESHSPLLDSLALR